MNLRLIACNIFQREACHCLVDTPHVVDPEFIQLGMHEQPERLRQVIQARIDAADAEAAYDAIILLFGLCGNATVGVHSARSLIVVPRAHDCATLLLGSREAFRTHFSANPSQCFGSCGYRERGYTYATKRPESGLLEQSEEYRGYVCNYGEENARFIWDTMHPPEQNTRSFFIETPQTAALGHAARSRAEAAQSGQEFVLLPGDIRLIRHAICGEWAEDDFLILQPGETLQGAYDWETVIRKG